MADCKYKLPCGKCDKYSKDCDADGACDHKWIVHGAVVITTEAPTTPNGHYRYLLCEKCGKHLLKPYYWR